MLFSSASSGMNSFLTIKRMIWRRSGDPLLSPRPRDDRRFRPGREALDRGEGPGQDQSPPLRRTHPQLYGILLGGRPGMLLSPKGQGRERDWLKYIRGLGSGCTGRERSGGRKPVPVQLQSAIRYLEDVNITSVTEVSEKGDKKSTTTLRLDGKQGADGIPPPQAVQIPLVRPLAFCNLKSRSLRALDIIAPRKNSAQCALSLFRFPMRQAFFPMAGRLTGFISPDGDTMRHRVPDGVERGSPR